MYLFAQHAHGSTHRCGYRDNMYSRKSRPTSSIIFPLPVFPPSTVLYCLRGVAYARVWLIPNKKFIVYLPILQVSCVLLLDRTHSRCNNNENSHKQLHEDDEYTHQCCNSMYGILLSLNGRKLQGHIR